MKKRLSIFVFFPVLPLLLSLRVESQDLSVEVERFSDSNLGVVLNVSAPIVAGWRDMNPSEYSNRKVGPFAVYYDYEEESLVPTPEKWVVTDQRPPYLTLIVAEPPIPADLARCWFQRQTIEVEGNYVDSRIEVAINIRRDGNVYSGKIPINIHRASPEDALKPDGNPLEIAVQTSDESHHEIKFKNLTGFSVQILNVGAVSESPRVLNARIHKKADRIPSKSEQSKTAFQLALSPETYSAFWASLIPYSIQRPHAKVLAELTFQVDGGHQAAITQDIRVRFVPSLWSVFLSVITGAFIAATVSMLITGIRVKKREKVFGKFTAFRDRLIEVLKRLGITIIVGLLVYLLYLFLRGAGCEVVLFKYPLDPEQCIPGFLIGFIVGLNPIYWYETITRYFSPKNEQQKAAQNLLLASVLSALIHASLPVNAFGDGQPKFVPVTLTFHQKSNSLYVLSTPENWIYRLDLKEPRTWKRIFDLKTSQWSPDQCLVPLDNVTLLAIVSNLQRGKGFESWTATVSIAAIDGPEQLRPIDKKSYRAFFSSTYYDEQGKRLVFSDPIRQGIYSIGIQASGLDSVEKRLFSHPSLRNPSSIFAWRGRMFVSDADQRAVFEVVPGNLTLVKIASDLSDPLGMAISADGARLFVADGAKAKVFVFNLATRELLTTLSAPDMTQPTSIAIDQDRHIWVSDQWERKLFEFGENYRFLGTLRPTSP